MSYFVHEYSNEEFETLEACEEDLRESIELEDILQYFDFDNSDILREFFKRKSDEAFCAWLFDKFLEAENHAADELITEYDEEKIE